LDNTKAECRERGQGSGNNYCLQSEACVTVPTISVYVKASGVLGLIARTISYKSPEVLHSCSLLKLYKTLVCPQVVEYCVSACQCLCTLYEKDKALLERIQFRFTRMVTGLKSLSLLYEESPDRLGLWALEERRNRADLHVFKVKLFKRLSCTQFSHFFTTSTVINYTRAHTAKIIETEMSA